MMLLEMNDNLPLVLMYAIEAMLANTESVVTKHHAAEPD